jgi:putative ABC transport system permease protein
VTATDAIKAAAPQGERRLPLLLGIAARELRSGISGFRIFIACVALGVLVITAVGAVSDALRAGFEKQGEAHTCGRSAKSATRSTRSGA